MADYSKRNYFYPLTYSTYSSESTVNLEPPNKYLLNASPEGAVFLFSINSFLSFYFYYLLSTLKILIGREFLFYC